MRIVPLTTVFAAALGLSGCASLRSEVFELQVNATTNPAVRPVASYRLQTRGAALDVNTLRHKEAEAMYKAALAGKGYYEAPLPDKADIEIVVDYGISPPLLREQTIKTITTDQYGNVREGFDTVLVTKYEKHVNMTATENKDATASGSGAPRMLWGVEVTNEDTSKDLRKYLPVMIGASIEYIGQETGEVRTIRISESNSAVGFVQKGL